MLIIPAIDLKDGCVVRYVQGRRDKKVYSRDPVKTALDWVKQGAPRLHVVDLDGALSGRMKNLSHVRAIVKAVKVPVQCGGGVRSLQAIRRLLKAGVSCVILGTRAVKDEAFLKRAAREFKGRIMVSVDAQANRVMTKGWRSSARSIEVAGFVKRVKEIGIDRIVFTDTDKDGTLKGPNLKETGRIIKETGIKLIVSGGISSLDDIRAIRRMKSPSILGIIVGKALYEDRFTLAEALKITS